MALMYPAGFTFLDSNGNPVASGSVAFYDTGTQNLRAIYTDKDLTIAATNPFDLDASGRFSQNLYGSGDYTVKCFSAAGGTGTTVFSRDSVFGWGDGTPYYERSAAEIAAGVTPTDYQYPYGDVRRYGAVGDGVTDDSAAVQAAVDVCPVAETGWGSTGGYASLSSRIVFPATDASYLIGTQIVIPHGTSIIFESDSPGWGARIKGTIDYAFRAATTSASWGWVEWSGLSFEDTGIQIDGNRRGMFRVRGCVFVDSPDYAIKGSGNSIVRGLIEQNKFSGCAGSVQFTGTDVDLITIRGNDFVRGNTNPDLDLNCYSGWVQDNDFETRLAADAAVPWVRLTAGGMRVSENRFGDEIVSTDFYPPRDAIQVGPDTPSGTSLSGVTIDHNSFRGSNGTASATTASSCVRLNAPVISFAFEGNDIAEAADYYTAVIHENYIDSVTSNIQKSYNNKYVGTRQSYSQTAPDFSHGGLGFDGYRPEWSDSQLPRQNLLRQSTNQADTLWLTTNASAAMDATGPDGVANTAATVTKAASGSSHIRTQLTGVASNTDGYVCTSVWLKAGTLDRAQVFLQQTTDNYPLVRNRVLQLTDEWKRFDMVFANIDAAKSYFFYVGASSATTADSNATGTILVYRPAAYNGFDVPDRQIMNQPTAGTQHAAPQFNGLILGLRTIGYGTAAPVSGRYEVGDIVLDTAPAAAGFIGWVCTTAGSPGTWKTWGAISA